jgi:rod shape-determining protein MreB
MFKTLRRLFSNDLSIDLGTANTRIYVKGKGIVLNEPSVVAVQHYGGEDKILAVVGLEAKEIVGPTPMSITAIRPMKEGVIADFMMTEKMLQYFIHEVNGSKLWHPSPRVLICVPCRFTQVERRAIRESAAGAGAREVFLIEPPMAAAIGAGLPFSQAVGSMVLDIGAETTDVGILSLNGIVYSESIRTGGYRFDNAIMSYVRRRYGNVIGEVTAERIKHEIGSAYQSKEEHKMTVRGRNVAEGIPRAITLNNHEILEALQEPLIDITSTVKTALEKIPPELAADVAGKGIVLTGGGALLKDLDRLVMAETGLPVILADDPLTCVARGGGRALDLIEEHGPGIIDLENGIYTLIQKAIQQDSNKHLL